MSKILLIARNPDPMTGASFHLKKSFPFTEDGHRAAKEALTNVREYDRVHNGGNFFELQTWQTEGPFQFYWSNLDKE